MLKVKLLSYTPNPELVVASAAKLCYSPVGVEEIIEKQTDESIDKFIKRLAAMKHLSPFEHVSFSFAVEGVSRVLTHQLVRHRIASFSQQSQRYVKEDNFEYIVPPKIQNNEKALAIFNAQMNAAQESYDEIVGELLCEAIKEKFQDAVETNTIDLINKKSESIGKVKRMFPKIFSEIEKKAIEDARFVFPGAAETKIVITMNARSLMNFFTLRCCNRAQWEIRDLADEMLSQVVKIAPGIFMNSGAPCTYGKCTEGVMSCGKVRTLDDIVNKKL